MKVTCTLQSARSVGDNQTVSVMLSSGENFPLPAGVVLNFDRLSAAVLARTGLLLDGPDDCDPPTARRAHWRVLLRRALERGREDAKSENGR